MFKTKIVVIGTEPPCPRCGFISKMIQDIIRGKADIFFAHIAYDARESVDFGIKKGYKIGTAKEIAKTAGMNIDWDLVYKTIEEKKEAAKHSGELKVEDLWSKELDALLMPCREIAEAYGYLMTPIIIVNDEVKHHGSVPDFKALKKMVLG